MRPPYPQAGSASEKPCSSATEDAKKIDDACEECHREYR
jgi:hypothetical protein